MQGIRNIIPTLKELGIQNDVVCLDAPNSAFIEKDDFKIFAIGQAKSPWAYNSKLPNWLKENAHKYDIIVVHGIWQYHSYITIKTITQLRKDKLANVPKIYIMPHGMLDPWFQRAKERRLKAIRNWWYWKFVEEKVIRKADGLLFTCEQELKLARTTFRPYKPQNEYNIGYGIQAPPPYTDRMKSSFLQACPELENTPYLLYLSRIHPKKGIDLLVNAYLELKEKCLELPSLVIVGPGLETSYGKTIKKAVASSKNIKLVGMLTGDAKWGAFYGCEAFILPSHQENFGIALVEAMACEKLVLTTNQVNIWSEIEHYKAGIIENDTQAGIKNLLLKYSSLSESERIQMNENAYNLFQSHFSVDSSSKKFKDLLLSPKHSVQI